MNRHFRAPALLLSLMACVSFACGAVVPSNSTQPEAWEDDADRGAPWMQFARYRFLDFFDIASFRGGVGPGLLFHARMTRFLSLGAGALGPQQPWRSGVRFEVHWAGMAGRAGGVWTERRAELGVSTFYYSESEGHALSGPIERFGAELRDEYDLGVEAFFGLVGVAIDVRPLEIADFMAGLVGLDPSRDDVTAATEPAPNRW